MGMRDINKKSWDKLSVIIQDSKSILLSTHFNADGDGLGSEIAFYYYLKDLNKDCRIINSSLLPYNFTVIDPDSLVECYNANMKQWIENVDLTIVFDIGDHRRIGEIGKHIYGNCTVVSIDHHPAREDHPYTLNLVDASSPVTVIRNWLNPLFLEA